MKNEHEITINGRKFIPIAYMPVGLNFCGDCVFYDGDINCDDDAYDEVIKCWDHPLNKSVIFKEVE